jgi:type IV pilus assembly protein PilM
MSTTNAQRSLLDRWRRPALPIGVDFGADGVRLVQVEASGEQLSVIAAARERWADSVRERVGNSQRPPDLQSVRPILDRMHRQGGFLGRRIAIALPRELVQVKNIRMPVMPEAETAEAARFEAQQVLDGVRLDTHEIRVVPLGEVKQGGEVRQDVLLLAVRRDDVDALVEQWHAVGFEPASIDFEPAAIYRAVERFVRRRDDESEVHALIDVGHRRTSVVIGRGRELNFYKAVDIGGQHLNAAVAKTLGLSIDEARSLRARLAATANEAATPGDEDPVRQAVYDTLRPGVEQLGREVGLCLRYFSVNFRGRRPTRVRVVGGTSNDPAVLRILASALPVPIDVGVPITNADLTRLRPADRTTALAEWTVAFGLSLRQCRGTFADLTGASRDEQFFDQLTADVTPATSAAGEDLVHA